MALVQNCKFPATSDIYISAQTAEKTTFSSRIDSSSKYNCKSPASCKLSILAETTNKSKFSSVVATSLHTLEITACCPS
jgi:hypothetical protein